MSFCPNIRIYFSFNEDWKRLLLGTMTAIMAAPISFLNALLLTALMKTKQINATSTNFIIAVIATSDLLSGLGALPLVSYTILSGGANGCLQQALSYVLAPGLGTVSASLTIVLALDRYVHINPSREQPPGFQKMFKQPFISVVICLAWLISFTSPVMSLLLSSDSSLHGLYLLIVAVFVFVMVILVSFLYTRAYCRIRNFVSSSPVHHMEDGTATRPRYLCSLFKTVLVLLITILVSYVPFSTGTIISSTYILFGIKQGRDAVLSFSQSTMPLLFTARLASPMIVLWHNRAACSWIKGHFCKFARKTKTTTNS